MIEIISVQKLEKHFESNDIAILTGPASSRFCMILCLSKRDTTLKLCIPNYHDAQSASLMITLYSLNAKMKHIKLFHAVLLGCRSMYIYTS